MENISINKNLTNIFLINGTFPLDRLRKKVDASYSQKQTTKTKQKKKGKKKQVAASYTQKQKKKKKKKKNRKKKTKTKTIFLFHFKHHRKILCILFYNFLKFSLFYFHFIYDSG